MDNIPEAPKSGKKTLWIVLLVILVLLIIGGFVVTRVIGAIGRKVIETAIEKGTEGDADVNFSNGEVTIQSDKGSVTYGSTKLPDDWPADVPVYPSAMIGFSGSSLGTEDTKMTAMIQSVTEDSVESVMNFYKKEIVSKGWKITGTQATAGTSVIVAEKDTRALAIQVVTDGSSGSSITISVGTK